LGAQLTEIAVFWITTIGMHYSGVYYGRYLPISRSPFQDVHPSLMLILLGDSTSYDNTGSPYNVSRILNDDFTLNAAEYEVYSPLFLSTTFSLAYGLSFASLTSILVHVGLFHGKEIYTRFKNRASNDLDDVHTKLMRHYPRVPWYWCKCNISIPLLAAI
jgi:hypothetical protein